eukprot:403341191
MSIITKLIKDGQSDDGNVILSKDVKKAFAQIAGLFSLYLFSTANDICKEKKLKKVSEQQVLQALNELGFDKYQESLKEFLKNYTEKEDEVKKTQYKKRKLQEDEEEHKQQDQIMNGDEETSDQKLTSGSGKRFKENYDQTKQEDSALDCQIVDLQKKQ